MQRIKRPKAIIINDISQSRKHLPIIRRFVNSVYTDRYRLVNASEIRRRVFQHLEKQPKYDLILLGDRGGTLIFSDAQLRRFGKKVARVPYSGHSEKGAMWQEHLKLPRLGKKPRILLLEGDVGPIGDTARKIIGVKETLKSIRGGAEIHAVSGVANKKAQKMVDFSFVAYSTPTALIRLSELMEGEIPRAPTGRKMPSREKQGLARAQQQRAYSEILQLKKKLALRSGRLPY